MSEYCRLEEVESGGIGDPLEAAALTVVYNSMVVVRQGMMTKELLRTGGATIKNDGTLVTSYDTDSEQLASSILSDMAPTVRFRGEEGTRRGDDAYAHELGLDPLDGTRNFAVGATDATVLATVYDANHSIYGAVIGQPSTGRLYSAFSGKPTEGRLITPNGELGLTSIYAPEVTTWQGGIDEKGQVFIDNNQPFPRRGQNTMTAEQHMDLHGQLQRIGAGVLELGGNGAHQLSVASGGEKAAVAITTARGVWEDTTAGLHLTSYAGGAVGTYNTVDGRIVPTDELDYDIAIAANNARNLARVEEIVTNL